MDNKYMNSSDFTNRAAKEVCRIMSELYGIKIDISELELVWFAHELGYKKCTFYAKKLGHYYPEVTYNREKNEMYIDIYLKQSNTKIVLDTGYSI